MPVARDGKLTPESIETLDMIAKYKLSLATSHLGADEALGPIRGPGTHLRNPLCREQRRVTLEDTAKFIREVGAGQTILASDSGQALNGPAPDGLQAFVLGLKSWASRTARSTR